MTEAATVTPLSTPSLAVWTRSKGVALRPGASAGLDYTDPAYFMRAFPLFGDFTVDAAEIFYSDGAPVSIRRRARQSPSPTTARSILSANAPMETLGIAWGLDSRPHHDGQQWADLRRGTVARDGAIQPSFGVTMGGGADTSILENYGEITVYSVPGSAIAVNSIGIFSNEGLIAAISEHARAIAVDAVFGTHSLDDVQSFFNTGMIYAEAGGVSQPAEYLGDNLVPGIYAATGVAARGTVTNDGDIIAVLGPNADPGFATVGVFVLNHYANHELLAGVTNNGTIEGTIAIKFGDDHSFVYSHWVINNGLLLGDVEFENGEGADEYDGSGGEIRGTVFGFGSSDSFLGGQFGDSFEGGSGDDTLDGGGGSDTASYSLAGSAVSVDLSLTGAQTTGGAGRDTLKNIENLLGSAHGDTLRGNAGANILDGRAGADRMIGGAGDDTYVCRSPATSPIEPGRDGIDRC